MIKSRLLFWVSEHLMPFKMFIWLQFIRSKLSSSPISVEPIPTVNLDFNGSIEKHIQRISFEISNTCNYTNIHPECPVSCYKQSTILNKDIVIKTLDELAGYGYKGFIAFHRYNEPMINKEPTRRLIATASSEIKRLLFLHRVDYLLPLSTLRVKDALILI